MEKEIERILEWLKQKGVYDQFIANLEKRYENKETYFSLFDSYSKLVSFCSAAFKFTDTPESADFWIKIYFDFHKDIRIYYRSKIKDLNRFIETLFEDVNSLEYDDFNEGYSYDQQKADILNQIESEEYKIKDLEKALIMLN